MRGRAVVASTRSATPARARRVARASRGALRRPLAGLALLAASAVLYGLTVAPPFTLEPSAVEVRGAVHTDPDAVRRALGLDDRQPRNVFRLRTREMAEALTALPAVTAADVRVVLPDRLVIELREREAILVWRSGRRAFLVDAEGTLFAPAADDSTARLPAVVDARALAPARVGDRLEGSDLAAVRRIAALTPRLLGSGARHLRFAIDDRDGFTVAAEPRGWTAIFGFYTPTLRPPSLIEKQVQCLTALLARDERAVRTVYLSPDRERCGTFQPARSGRSSPSPAPP